MAGVDQIHALVDVSSDGLGTRQRNSRHGGVCLVDGCVSDIDQFGEVFVLVLVISVVIIVTVVVAAITLIVGLLLTGSVALLALTERAVASGTPSPAPESLGWSPSEPPPSSDSWSPSPSPSSSSSESLEEVVLLIATGSVIVALVVPPSPSSLWS